jgi:hypothetical protein
MTWQSHFLVSPAAHQLVNLESSKHIWVLGELFHLLDFSWSASQLALNCTDSLIKLTMQRQIHQVLEILLQLGKVHASKVWQPNLLLEVEMVPEDTASIFDV